MSRSTIKDPAKSKSSETFFKVLRFIGRYRFLLIFSIILAAVSVILQLYVPILFGNAIDQVIAQHQVNFEMMWYYLSRILVMVILSSAATGGSLHALDALAARSSGTIVAQAAVLAEGDAAERKDIIFLEPLPLFAH